MSARQKSPSFASAFIPTALKRLGAAHLILAIALPLLFAGISRTYYAAARLGADRGEAAKVQVDVEEVTLTISADGFDPPEVIRPAGRFMLSVDNRSGADELTLTLKRGNGVKVLEIKVPSQKGDWSEVIDLQPGRYTLSEAGHPDWKCDFRINERR
jgi:hypothetical protein